MKNSVVRQAAVLVGGKGSRLGDATRFTPKPLMAIAEGRVFLDSVLDQLARQGFDDILLLAGHFSEQIVARYSSGQFGEARIRVVAESQPLGTGGALFEARGLLDDRFLVLNGDSYLDTNLRALAAQAEASSAPALLALRRVEDARRYGTVELAGTRITRFAEKNTQAVGSALINAGIYVLTRQIAASIGTLPCSIETDVFPKLAAADLLEGVACDGYFIDIGLPDTLEAARREMPVIDRRPAAFLDRDGVINLDTGYTHAVDQLVFVEGAVAAIRSLNDLGYRVVVVTNQAGVAHGYYDEAAVRAFHAEMNTRLAAEGAYIDRFYYCPYHPEGRVRHYRQSHPDRKPEPGMVLRAFADLPIDIERSFLIGDKPSDIEAARGAGIPGFLFTGGNLSSFLAHAMHGLPQRKRPGPRS